MNRRYTHLAPILVCWLLAPAGAAAQGLTALNTVGLGEELTTMTLSHKDPSFVLVGTATGKLYRSENGGASWQEVTITPARSLFWGRERSPDESLEYAPGLPGKSPHLQSWLRSKGLHTSGVNLQQLLVRKGDKMVSINWIEVDWNDENRVYVATVDGLYRSTDKGRTFIRIFQGHTSSSERVVNTVATDPNNPNVVVLGTAKGLFISRNRGVGFRKTMNYYMRDSYIREIWFDPEQPGLIHVAMAGSAMASPDGGKNWITTHWDEWGPRADVQSMSLGPQDVRLIGTGDGVWASFQGGEMGTWVRRGIRFVGMPINKVMATENPQVWLCMTHQAIWFTSDAGLNWNKVFQTGGKEWPRWMTTFEGKLSSLWFVTNRTLYRVGLPELLKGRVRTPRRSPWSAQRIPSLYALHKKILRHNRIYFADNQKFRARAPWASLLPSLTLAATYSTSLDSLTYKDYVYFNYPWYYYSREFDVGLNLEVMATWDLTRLIFDKREVPHWGRIQRNLSGARMDIGERVHRLYMEYRRVASLMSKAPPSDPEVRLNQEFRLEEITAYFDALSGGYWSKALKEGDVQ